MRERFSTKGGKSYPVRHGEPPAWSFFATERPASGPASVVLGLDALRIRLDGLETALADAIASRFAPYASTGADDPGVDLAVRVSREPVDYFIEPPETAEFNPVWIACDGTRVRYVAYVLAGWLDTAARRGAALLGSGTWEPATRAIENFLRCAVAWCAAERGGALVHGASAVHEGRGYLFFGESGAGKSTLSEVSRRGRVVSDDLSLVLPRHGGGGLDLIGSPFRGTFEGGEPVVGRFPLAAAFRIVQAPEAAVLAPPRAVVLGQLVGSLTFVAEAYPQRPDLFERLERAFGAVPLRQLAFRKDDSYWDAIAGAGL